MCGQDIVLKWATGHERWAYVVVLHGSDEDWMRSSDFDTFINDYIDKAPADVPNRAFDKAYMRYHGQIGQSDAYYTSQIGKLYAREVCAQSRS